MPGAGSVGSVALALRVPRAPRARRPRKGVHCTLGSAPWLVAVGLGDALTSCQACWVPTDSGLVCAEEQSPGLVVPRSGAPGLWPSRVPSDSAIVFCERTRADIVGLVDVDGLAHVSV